ncbi:S26 family signal peptidase [Haloquadratum walsbyi]|jgi:signal peptidase I, archaeal type|uniref:Signal peptidase I n=1 Tax=Haloquadratum walsbyi J07HQW2 TaxID=1238425 RepID=U1NGI1_9EURY|nr:S26 family signal peptidase [Haloquadratum walsbyi]ERG95923.1 MAG: hypothetical protein J07HQW2_02383 [Haloquadratum walsbyi J07HQW2]
MTDNAGDDEPPEQRYTEHATGIDDSGTEDSPTDIDQDTEQNTNNNDETEIPFQWGPQSDRGADDVAKKERRQNGAESDNRDQKTEAPTPDSRSEHDNSRYHRAHQEPKRTSKAGTVTRIRRGAIATLRETIYSIIVVVAIGFILFAISGVWPPMVAVESGSMEPEMSRGDLILVTETTRFSPGYAHEDTGVVTAEIGKSRGYQTFSGTGSVIIYDPPQRVGSPIIHRAHFFVEDGENWYEEANSAYLNVDGCDELRNCPAPHAGFITKGDANARYDQATGIAGPVRPMWIRGAARLRIPYLGYVRLQLAGALAIVPVLKASNIT